eukprot:XP_014786625.1 PREDICTED: zinc finger protein 492-like [Octopus bimaculoides]
MRKYFPFQEISHDTGLIVFNLDVSLIFIIFHKVKKFATQNGYIPASINLSTSLAQHKHTHTSEKPCHCVLCGESFSQSGKSSSHEHVRIAEKLFICDICGKSFSRNFHLTTNKMEENTSLAQHKHTHTGEKPCHCVLCGESFSQSGKSSSHEHVRIAEKLFICDICSKSFSRNFHLTTNKHLHTQE